MKTKIQSLLQQLNQGLVEREHVLKLAMLTTLAGENLVLVGPPGTGKSLVARRIAQSLSHEGEGDGAGYFEYLLTKFSTPEELFGPLSIAALKNDRFHGHAVRGQGAAELPGLLGAVRGPAGAGSVQRRGGGAVTSRRLQPNSRATVGLRSIQSATPQGREGTPDAS